MLTDSAIEAGKFFEALQPPLFPNEPDTYRCYLYGFLNPLSNPKLAHDHAEYKLKLVKEARDAREQKYKAQRKLRIFGGKQFMDKDWKERQQERADQDEVDKKLRETTFEWAKVAFYGGPDPKNPFHDGIADTMFWM